MKTPRYKTPFDPAQAFKLDSPADLLAVEAENETIYIKGEGMCGLGRKLRHAPGWRYVNVKYLVCQGWGRVQLNIGRTLYIRGFGNR